MTYDELFIDGRWVAPAASGVIDVISPATEEVIGRAPAASTADVDRAVEAARRAFDEGPWPRMAAAERIEVLSRALELYVKRADEIAELVTAEMGCPVMFARAFQADYPAGILQYNLGLAQELVFEERRGNALVLREPVGVVAAIAAWNFPQAILLFKLAPAFLTGCTVVAKPAPETPLDALLLAEVFEEAGLPEGVLNVVPAERDVSEYLVTHPGVDKVAFTGSSAAGRRIAALCGQDVRRYGLELGGKSAAVLLEDADLDSTLARLHFGSMANSGQRCGNQTRILVHRSRYEEVIEGIAALMDTMVVGDPTDPTTQVGPLVASRQRERVESYIQSGLEEGAKLVRGGGRPAHLPKGWYVEPTLFRDVDNRMTIAREEIFGPVLGVIPYDTEDEAVAIANDSTYGLSGGVWSGDPDRAMRVARRIRTGTISINGAETPFDVPFGGFKHSGVGREAGPEGMLGYVEVKSIPFPAAS